MKVYPALLSQDEADYRAKLALVASFTGYAQIDFMDGRFVPSSSVGPEAAAAVPVPFDWEAHLMVVDPLGWLARLPGTRLRRVIFHLEAVKDPAGVAAGIRRSGFEPGLALNPGSPASAALELAPSLSSVLVMSVNPGFYGSPFIPEVLDKVTQIKATAPRLAVGVDGGIGEGNLARAREAGADYVCVGSRILLAENPADSHRRLSELAEAGPG